jgi:cellulose synthase/poly-beta-1,6-N-acetylglucosamine synthase-like glycosyltransferase
MRSPGRAPVERRAPIRNDDSPSVSVIIPAYNPGEDLERCVRAVIDQDLPESEFEIVVVDNGSDPPVENRWGDRVRIVREAEPGSYAARNAGLRATTAPVLAFTDADCTPAKGWLRAGVAGLDAGASVITGPVQLYGGDPPTIAEHFEFRYGFPQDRYLDEGFGVTANLFVRRSAIDDAGDFDQRMRSGGDREFGQRLARHGHQTTWCPGAVVSHPARREVSQLLAKARRTAAGTLLLETRTSSRPVLVWRSLWLLRPPVKVFARVYREERDLRPSTRLRLAGLVFAVRATVCASRLRALLGVEAPR